jgi:hypothetical protein
MKKPTVFVLMPFAQKYNDVYQLGIKEPLEKIGLICERADEIQFSGEILRQIIESIKNSNLILADVTSKNANVFYELGYAHSLGREPILITEKSENIAFDLSGFNHIVYGRSIIRLREKLVDRVNALLNKNSKKSFF